MRSYEVTFQVGNRPLDNLVVPASDAEQARRRVADKLIEAGVNFRIIRVEAIT